MAFKAPPAGSAADNQRYEHISRVLARFDYPQRNVSLRQTCMKCPAVLANFIG